MENLKFEIDPVFLPPKELERRTGISVQTLANERHLRMGLPYTKRGKSVLYFWPEIFSILRSGRIAPRVEE